jgi:hypothetical protein
MNTRKAAPVIVTMSLVVLMSGCAGAAAQGGQVQDYLGPAANAAELGLARGHVIVRDDLSPTRVENRRAAESAPQAVKEQGPRAWSAEARRELHAKAAMVEQGFSADVIRELKGSAEVTVEQSFSADVIRELKGSAPVTVDDDLSPIQSGRSTSAPTPQPDTVDDDLSPLGGQH